MPKYKVIAETEIVTKGKTKCDDMCSHLGIYDGCCSLYGVKLKDDDGDALRCSKCLEATENIVSIHSRRKK